MNRRFAAGVALALALAGCSAPPPPGAGNVSAEATPTPASEPATASPQASAPPSREMTSDEPQPSAPAALTSDPLHAITLTDVRSGEELTIGELAASRPLLLETMAIWCSNCRAQQHNVVAAHNQADFHSISLDVDPGEQPEDLGTYAEREGFDWHFAMADAEVLSQLRDRFGTAVAVPPSMPKILFRTDGSIEMIGLGELYTAQQIADAVGG